MAAAHAPEPLLTIAVPTYNRNDVLARVLARVLPQLTPACRLVVFDNCSTQPVAETLTPLLAGHPAADVQIVRHKINLGMSGNFLRCYESCTTEWLWLLADDDLVAGDAVATVLRNVASRPDCTFFNFCNAHVTREAAVITRGIDELIARLDHLGLLLFLSVGVYRAPRVLPHLRLGYHHAHTMAPHLALLFAALSDTGVCCLSPDRIVEQQSAGGYAGQWSHLDACLGMASLAELEMSPDSRRRLLRMIAGDLRLEAATYQLLGRLVQGRETYRSAIFFFDQVWRRTWYYHRDITTYAKSRFYRLLLRVPGPGFRFFVAVKRRRGRTDDEMIVPDRYDRTE